MTYQSPSNVEKQEEWWRELEREIPDSLVGPNRPKEVPEGEFSGPVRRLFLRREGLFEYISPGFLASSIISFASLGIIVGFGGVLVGGLIQDWANEEEAFSWARSLNGN